MGRRQASIPLVNISGRNDSLNIPDAPEHEVAEKNVFYFRGAGMEKARTQRSLTQQSRPRKTGPALHISTEHPQTIEPLFLDEHKEEFDKAYDDTRKFDKLLARSRVFETFMPSWIPTRANYDLAA